MVQYTVAVQDPVYCARVNCIHWYVACNLGLFMMFSCFLTVPVSSAVTSEGLCKGHMASFALGVIWMTRNDEVQWMVFPSWQFCHPCFVFPSVLWHWFGNSKVIQHVKTSNYLRRLSFLRPSPTWKTGNLRKKTGSHFLCWINFFYFFSPTDELTLGSVDYCHHVRDTAAPSCCRLYLTSSFSP